MQIRPPLLASVLAASLLLSGCASKYGEQITPVNYYPQCYQPIGDLRADENAVAKSTAAGAVGGALLGAAIGGLASGDWKGAVAGAAVGGASGAVAGNVYGKQQQQERDAAFLAQYSQMLDEDLAGMTRTLAAARVAKKCYNDEFAKIVEDFKAKRITKNELAERYNEIRAGLQEISYVLNQRYDTMKQKDQEYQAALDTEYTQAKPVSPAKVSKPPKSIKEKASQFKGTMVECQSEIALNDQDLELMASQYEALSEMSSQI